jgi:hypothetical protein
MTIAWYDPTNHHVSTDKNDPLFTPLGQLLPLDVPREWVDLTDAEKDGKRVLENGLLFNAAEVQAWELGIDYAESKLKERNA